MHPRLPLLVVSLLLVSLGSVACANPVASICGDGARPVVATGLSGLLDETMPAVEVVRLVGERCEPAGSTWMFFDDAASAVTLGPEPTSGVLGRDGVDVTDETIFFRAYNVGVRLEYTDSSHGQLALVWFSMGANLSTVDCSADPELACAIRE